MRHTTEIGWTLWDARPFVPRTGGWLRVACMVAGAGCSPGVASVAQWSQGADGSAIDGSTRGAAPDGGATSDGDGAASHADGAQAVGAPPDAAANGSDASGSAAVDAGHAVEGGNAPDAGGRLDAGSVVQGDGGPVTPCAGSQYLICEDFESTAVGAVPAGWTRSGDVMVSADDAFQSAQSLKVFVTAGKTENYRSISMNPSKLGTGHWGRIYYKVQTPVPAYFAHDTFLALTGSGPDPGFQNENVRVVDTVQQANNTHQFLYNVQPSGTEFGKGSSYRFTFADGGWHCAEWHVDNPTQNYHFYYDGVEVTDVAITNGAGNNANAEIPAVFTNLTVGISQYQSPPAGFTQQPMWFTAWIDNVALDTNRIGCQ